MKSCFVINLEHVFTIMNCAMMIYRFVPVVSTVEALTAGGAPLPILVQALVLLRTLLEKENDAVTLYKLFKCLQ